MDQILTPALLNGVGVVGLLVGQFWMLSTGRLLTRREGDGLVKRAETAESTAATVIAQNGELLEMARLGQAIHRAIGEGTGR